MDDYLGFDEWKKEGEDPYYDYLLVKKVIEQALSVEILKLPSRSGDP